MSDVVVFVRLVMTLMAMSWHKDFKHPRTYSRALKTPALQLLRNSSKSASAGS